MITLSKLERGLLFSLILMVPLAWCLGALLYTLSMLTCCNTPTLFCRKSYPAVLTVRQDMSTEQVTRRRRTKRTTYEDALPWRYCDWHTPENACCVNDVTWYFECISNYNSQGPWLQVVKEFSSSAKWTESSSGSVAVLTQQCSTVSSAICRCASNGEILKTSGDGVHRDAHRGANEVMSLPRKAAWLPGRTY